MLHSNWLTRARMDAHRNPRIPDSTTGPWRRYIDSVDISLRETNPLAEREDYNIGTVRYPRTVPKDEESAKRLKKRTLTNLYNQRPTWLDLAHQKLDTAVFAALLALNLDRVKQ